MFSRGWVLLTLVACAPASSGRLKTHLAAGYDKLAAKQFVEARKEFAAAEDALDEEPSDEAANAVHDGYARVDAGLIEAAIDTASKIRGDDAKLLAELHRLRLRLRTIGGNPALEAAIATAMNIRASQLIAPHEAAKTLTDLAPLLELGKYPELDESNRKRIGALIIKSWRVYRDRATAATPELVRRTFEGLAAVWSGASVADARTLRDRELATYSRGSKVTGSGEGSCAALDGVLERVQKVGAYQVDAQIHGATCTSSARSESRTEQETYYIDIPYTTTETYQEQVCNKIKVPVSYCINPYLGNGCVGSSDTVDSYECHFETRTGLVTRYTKEPHTRDVTRTTTYTTMTAKLDVTLTYGDKSSTQIVTATTELVNGQGPALSEVIVRELDAALDGPVKATIDARAADLRTQADAALSAGRLDDAELGYLRILFLGRDPGDYFERTYAVSVERLRAALERHTEAKPVAIAATESLPDVTDERRDSAIAFARDRFASTFPPALSRARGLWYNAELGTISYETSGTTAAFQLRWGFPLLARIHGRTRGFGLWDDASLGGGLGYGVTKGEQSERHRLMQASGAYTAVVGVRVPTLQILAGARGSVLAIKQGDVSGASAALSYYANLAFQIGQPSLAFEAWYPTGHGEDTRGAQVYLAVKTPGDQYKNMNGATVPTSYVAFRAQEQHVDALAVTDFMVLFGAGFH